MARSRHRPVRLLVAASLAFALAAPLAAPTSASAWLTSPSGFEAHDWFLHEADLVARSYGYTWLDTAEAAAGAAQLEAVDGASHVIGPRYPASSPPVARVAALYSVAASQRASGDWTGASRTVGMIAHHLGDLGEPMRATKTSPYDPAVVDYETRAHAFTNAAGNSHGWLGAPVAGLDLVRDPAAEAAGLAIVSASRAPAVAASAGSLSTLESAVVPRRMLAETLPRSIPVLAEIIASLTYEGDPVLADVERIAGADRYATAVQASRSAFPAGVPAVVVASGETWPDALTAASLAGALGGPILLTRRTTVPPAVLAEVSRLGAGRVILVGGRRALDSAVGNAFAALGTVTRVERVAGADRYGTAAAVAARTRAEAGTRTPDVFVVSGTSFPDALAVSPHAFRRVMPILLTTPTGLPAATIASLTALEASTAVVAGGTAAVPKAAADALAARLGSGHVTRVAGADRFATSAALRDFALASLDATAAVTGIASGEGFADALSAGPAIGVRSGAVVLTRHTRLPEPVSACLARTAGEVATITVAGGEARVSGLVERDALHAIDPSATPPPDLPPWTPGAVVSYSHESEWDDPTPRCYYLDLRRSAAKLAGYPKDANGVVMVYSGGTRVYNPTTVGLYALANWELLVHDGDTTARARFLVQAKWLRDNLDAYGRWPYRYYLPERGFRAPWYSALAQGYGISTMVRAYEFTGDASYLRAAEKAYRPYTVSVRNGGVAVSNGADLWFEEYPDSHHVLNGYIFAIWGLHDLARLTGRADVAASRDRAVATLARNLGAYEHGGYVLYEVWDHHWSRHYHQLQIDQLRACGTIFGDTRLSDRGDLWTLVLPQPPSGAAAAGAPAEPLGPPAPDGALGVDPSQIVGP